MEVNKKYQYGVIDASRTIAESVKGTGDYSHEEINAMASWLKWRINEAWDESPRSRGSVSWAYDAAVRRLADLALLLHDSDRCESVGGK